MALDTGNIIAIIALAFSGLISTGAVAFIFRYGVRLAVVEDKMASKVKDLTQVKEVQGIMTTRLALVETAVLEMKEVLPQLRELPVISSKLDQLVEVMKTNVPRTELDARFETVHERLDSLENP